MKKQLLLFIIICVLALSSSQAKIVDEELIRVVIEFKEPDNNYVKAHAIQSFNKKDFDVLQELKFSGRVVAMVSEEAFASLKKNPSVKNVQKDEKITSFLNLDPSSVDVIGASDMWGVQVGGVNVTGLGQTVCVIDSGIDYTHPDLGGCTSEEFLDGNCSKVLGGIDLVNSDDDPWDDNSHGTHVAGTIAANGSIKGVAPDAKLIAIKVLDSSGDGWTSSATEGIIWCTNNATKYNITVISLSLGSVSTYTSYCDSSDTAMRDAINNAVANNISVVTATGNSGSTTRLPNPACITNSTRVGGASRLDAFYTSTNRATYFSDILLAPGMSINSTWNNGGYGLKTGTSMAAPHVSGAIALLNQRNELEEQPKMQPINISELLYHSAGKFVPDPSLFMVFPRINIFQALNWTMKNESENPNITINYPINSETYFEHINNMNFTATDDYVLKHCWYTLDNGVTNTSITCENNTVVEVTNILSNEGTNNWTIHIEDLHGNTDSQTTTFDVEMPIVDITVLSESYLVNPNTTFDVSLNVSCISGICGYINTTLFHAVDLVSFTTAGSHQWVVPSHVEEIDVLVVAGGGSGGRTTIDSYKAGGGGAGGLIYEKDYVVTPLDSISVSVGNGGAGTGSSSAGNQGQNSLFSDLIAVGGGRGGGGGSSESNIPSIGGSGGGGGTNVEGANGTSSQGYKGGTGGTQTIASNTGGGGGGAGSQGFSGQGSSSDPNVGSGGLGLYYGDIFGDNVGDNGWFASGGGGAGAFSGPAPIGGGGAGGGTNAKANTGGGGGGTKSGMSGNGGRGVVLIKYKGINSSNEFASSLGLISTNTSSEHFFTLNDTNPLTTNYLSEGEYQIITFKINATGNINDSYIFYAFANSTEELKPFSDKTNDFIVNITEDTLLNPNLNILGSSPISYGSEANITGINCPAELTCNLYRNGTAVTNPDNSILGANYYHYVFNTTGNENYESQLVDFYLTVNQAAPVLNISGSSPIVYGVATDVGGGGCPAQLTCTLTPSNGVLGAGTHLFNYSTSGNENYTSAYATTNIEINKKELNISANNYDKIYGDSDPELDVSYSGFIIDENESNLSGTLLVSRDSGEIVGFYNVVPSSLTSNNYDIQFINGTFEIKKKSISITADNKEKTYGDSDPILSHSITSGGLAFADEITGSLTRTIGESVGSYNILQGTLSINVIENYNLTFQTGTLTVNQAVPVLNISGSSPITYGTLTNVEGTGCPAQLTCTLAPSNGVLGAGTHLFNYSTSGNENYTSAYATTNIEINKAIPTGSISGISPISYGSPANIEGLDCPDQITCNLYRNGTLVTNPDIEVLSVGTYSYIFNTSGGENYTDTEIDTFDLLVAPIDNSCLIVFNKTSPISYPNTFRVWALCDSEFTLRRNGLIIEDNSTQELSAGTYNFTLNRTDTENYTNNYDEKSFTINKAMPVLNIGGSSPITYGTLTNVEGTGCPAQLTCTLTPSNDVLSVGTHLFNYSTSGNENYTSAYAATNITINKAASEIGLWLNHARNNLIITESTEAWLNASTITGDSFANLKLFINSSLINEGVSPLSNLTLFSVPGFFNVTAVYEETQNYTGSTESWSVTVNELIVPPTSSGGGGGSISKSDASICDLQITPVTIDIYTKDSEIIFRIYNNESATYTPSFTFIKIQDYEDVRHYFEPILSNSITSKNYEDFTLKYKESYLGNTDAGRFDIVIKDERGICQTIVLPVVVNGGYNSLFSRLTKGFGDGKDILKILLVVITVIGLSYLVIFKSKNAKY